MHSDNPRVNDLEEQLAFAREKRGEAEARIAQLDVQITALEAAIAAEEAAAPEEPSEPE